MSWNHNRGGTEKGRLHENWATAREVLELGCDVVECAVTSTIGRCEATWMGGDGSWDGCGAACGVGEFASCL